MSCLGSSTHLPGSLMLLCLAVCWLGTGPGWRSWGIGLCPCGFSSRAVSGHYAASQEQREEWPGLLMPRFRCTSSLTPRTFSAGQARHRLAQGQGDEGGLHHLLGGAAIHIKSQWNLGNSWPRNLLPGSGTGPGDATVPSEGSL